MTAKARDDRGRWRSVTVGFRVSPEESKMINDMVSLSGMKKQEYLISRALGKDIIVNGNPKVYKALKHQMMLIYEEIRRISSISDISENSQEMIKIILKVYAEMKKEVKGDE